MESNGRRSCPCISNVFIDYLLVYTLQIDFKLNYGLTVLD